MGKTSKATIYLREELKKREKMLLEEQKIPFEKQTTQRTLYYHIRDAYMGGIIDIDYDHFCQRLLQLCRKMGGDLYREKLGILAEERAQLSFRWKKEAISLDNFEDLARYGSDVLLVEKGGIVNLLNSLAQKYGVTLIHSKGFAVDYARVLCRMARENGGRIWVLSDWDASGIILANKIEAKRIGIDQKTLDYFNLRKKDVETEYEGGKPPITHLKALEPEEREPIERKRVEIDMILDRVGNTPFWKYLMDRMNEEKIRNLNRSVSLGLPANIRETIDKIQNIFEERVDLLKEKWREKLASWDKGIVEVEKLEDEWDKESEEYIREQPEMEELVEKLEKIAEG